MELYEYHDQDGKHVVSRQEILDMYWEHWKSLMETRHDAIITQERCVQDFCTVHQAHKVRTVRE